MHVLAGRPRLAPLVLSASVALVACGGAGPKIPDTLGRPTPCTSDDLLACEDALATAIERGGHLRLAARAYLDARRGADGDDVLAKLGEEALRDTTRPVVFAMGGGAAPPSSRARVVVHAGPPPEAGHRLGPHGWLLAISAATGRHAIAVTREGARIHAIAEDPLRPLVAGLPAVVKTTSAKPVDDDVEMAASVETAFRAASAFDHLAAARAGERITTLRQARDEADALGRRGRVAEIALSSAGITLEPPGDVAAPTPVERDGSATFAASPPAPPPPPDETPYEGFLAVRVASDMAAAYAVRNKTLGAALGSKLAPLFELWIGAPADAAATCPGVIAPDFSDDRQLAFGGLLPRSLLPARVAPENARGRLALADWYPRYDAFRKLAEQRGLTWWALSTLLTERGSGSGISPSGTETHRAVTASAKKQLRALGQLVAGAQGRAGFATIGAVALLFGVREDPELQPLVVELAQRSTQLALANAKDAGDVAMALVSGIATAITYPPELQGAQLGALQGAFTAQLRGNLAGQKGWAVAGLLALDAVYRIMFQQAPDLPGSSAAISRALSGADVEQPGLAALAVAATRYAALGATGELGAPFLEDGKGAPKPLRAQARTAMRDALAHLGGEGVQSPSAAAVDDLADLVDGTVATLALSLGETKTDAPAACSDAPRDPKVTRALGKLRDVRRKLVASAWFDEGDDAWSRRARLLVLVASDAFDLAESGGPGATFAIPNDKAARILIDAVDGWSPNGTADLVAGAHGLARGYLAKVQDDATKSRALRRAMQGAHTLLTDEKEGPLAGGGVVDLIANRAVLGEKTGDLSLSLERDLLPALLREAERRSKGGDRAATDLLLLVIAGLSAATDEHYAPQEAVDLARTTNSRAAWVLVERQTASKLVNAEPIDEAAVRAALATAVPPECGKATTDLVADVASAVAAFRSGRRDAARTTMRAVVEKLESAPAALPRTTFQYQENAGTRVLQATIGMSLGAGLLTSSNTFQLGLGFQSTPVPRSSSLRVSLDPIESSTTTEISARFAVHAAALAAVFELLGGDAQRAERAGAVAYARATRGARPADDQPPIAKDAAGALAVAAQLFAESGRPILAGDLLALVKSTIGPEASDDDVAEILDRPPFGLPKSPDGEAATARAKKTLAVLAEKLACTKEKVDLARFETPRCEAYPLAIALRVADSVPRLPRLAVRDAKACTHASLDRFFAKMESGSYDPDALTSALSDRVAHGHGYDASILLTRLRPQEHCNPAIVAAARRLGDTPGLPPAVRADARFTAAKCDPSLLAESAVSIDELYMQASDLEHTGELLFFAARVAEATNDATALARLASRPGYHERWVQRNATLAAASLALDHAAAVMSPQPGSKSHLDAVRPLATSLCTTFASPERASPCTAIAGLAREDVPAADKNRLAKETVSSIVKAMSAP